MTLSTPVDPNDPPTPPGTGPGSTNPSPSGTGNQPSSSARAPPPLKTTGLSSPRFKSPPPYSNQPNQPGAPTSATSGATTIASNQPNQPGASTNATPSAPTSAFAPDAPKFGGLTQVKTDEWAAWTGGKPNGTWTGLETAPSFISPNQYRPSSIIGQSKSREIRITGRTEKFAPDSDLLVFQRDLGTHFDLHGLSTIRYVNHPSEANTVVDVIEKYSLFDYRAGIDAGKAIEVHYDSYCHTNTQDGVAYLLNSVSPDLKSQLYDMCSPQDTFITNWFSLIHIVRSVSTQRFEKIKKRIMGRKPDDFSEQDIIALASAFWKDFQELHSASMYDHSLTLIMISIFMTAGGRDNEDFKSPLRTLKRNLNKNLLKIRHMTYSEKEQHMLAAELDVQSVLNQVKEEYRTLLDDGLWAPASHIKDTNTLPKSFGSTANKATASTEELNHLAHALLKTMSQTKTKNQQQHRKDPNKQQSQKKKSQRNNPPKPASGGGRKSDKPPPPKAGDNEICTIKGKQYRWCAICKRWTLSHGTDGHMSNDELKARSNTAKLARVGFDFQPSAHFVSHDPSSPSANYKANFAHYGPPDPPAPSLRFKWWYPLLFVLGLSLLYLCFQETLLVSYGIGSTLALLSLMAPLPWTMRRVPSANTTVSTSLSSGSRTPARARRARRRRLRRQHRNLPSKVSIRRVPKSVSNRRRRKVQDKYNNIARPCRRHSPHLGQFVHRGCMPAHVKNLHNKIETCKRTIKQYDIRTSRLRSRLRRVALAHKQSRKLAQDMEAKFRALEAEQRAKESRLAYRAARVFRHAVNVVSSRLFNVATLDNTKSQSYPGDNRPGRNVLFDSGANCCITFDKADFIPGTYESTFNEVVDGIGKGLKVQGKGLVAWTFEATNGAQRTLKLPCLHVPSCNTKIASLHQVLKTYPDETINMNRSSLRLSGSPTDNERPSVHIPFGTHQNLPLGKIQEPTPYSHLAHPAKSKPLLPSTPHPALTSPLNANLTEAEKEILRWHQKLGHFAVRRVQWMMRNGLLAHTESARRLHKTCSRLNHGPMCTACQYAKQRRKTKPGSTLRAHKDEAGITKQDALHSGARIFVDHFTCNPPGRRFETQGKEPVNKKLKGATVFVDAASGYIHVVLESNINATNTVKAKEDFELFCSQNAVVPQCYVTDKGSDFTSATFLEHVAQQKQSIR